MSFKQVIIWGFPLHTHTHPYIHGGWFKGFKHLGYNTYWFDDNNIPSDFDFNDTLFINGQILKIYKISNYYSVIKTYFFIKILILLSHQK